jgi:hypothetical protein
MATAMEVRDTEVPARLEHRSRERSRWADRTWRQRGRAALPRPCRPQDPSRVEVRRPALQNGTRHNGTTRLINAGP